MIEELNTGCKDTGKKAGADPGIFVRGGGGSNHLKNFEKQKKKKKKKTDKKGRGRAAPVSILL